LSPGRPSTSAAAICLLAAIFVLVLLAATPAVAMPSPANQARLDSTVRYLQNVQQAGGGFGEAGEPSQITSAWVALALAAAGVNPQDQALPGGVDAYTFLATHFQQAIGEELCAPLACTTTFERELMVVNASGAPPHDFAGVDLVGELLARERPDGSFPLVPGGKAGVNDTVFAILALAPVHEAAAQAPIQRAADWVEAAQQDNGGWSWNDRNSPDEVDMTGTAIQALVTAGRHGTAAVQRGLEYLREAQNPDGGFPALPGDPESNVASTAWAVQAIWSVGENPETWLTGSGGATEEPLDYMESLQEADGHIRWKRSSDMNGVWMTAYVAPAFAGQEWPIPAVPRAIKQPVAPEQPGSGGEGAQAGDGVIAGGGGAGAPLFSRPKPQSKGKTPGGARIVHGKPAEARNHSKTRRGERAKQSTRTATAEPTPQHPESSSGDDGRYGSAGSSAGGDGGGQGTAAGQVARAGTGERPPRSARLPGARGDEGGTRGRREVVGTLVGASAGNPRQGPFAFAAPGLHGAGAGGTPWLAIAIAAAALLLGLAGSQLERRGTVFP
jgi:hypothetical protein